MSIHQAIDISRVFETHQGELRALEEYLLGMFRSESILIQAIGRHIHESGGKRIRPLFLLASAALMGYKGKDHIVLASVIESIHTASLLHDDVVDNAEMRRGKPVANSIWGNAPVILVGDFLYSTALRHSVMFKNVNIIDILASSIAGMTQGELIQLQKLGDTGITEEDYLTIISAKTGVLISAACRLGAIVAGASAEREEAIAHFGLKAGMAFQMADDILDYMADEGALGKKLGTDLSEGKITLPLILLLKAANQSERAEVGRMIENGIEGDGLKRMLELFDRYKVLEDASKKAKHLVEEAKEALSIFPPSQQREALFELAEYALARGK